MPSGDINLPVPSDELEDSFAGATERLITIHFGVPNIGVTTPDNDIFRWDQPMSMRDARNGQLGARSMMWHPSRTLSVTEAGTDGKDFNRQGDDTDSAERWGE